jgi:hypothetical protein
VGYWNDDDLNQFSVAGRAWKYQRFEEQGWDRDASSVGVVEVCPGDTFTSNELPPPTYVNYFGTGTLSSMVIWWYLDAQDGMPCGAGNSEVIGGQLVTNQTMADAFMASPGTGMTIPASTVPGNYFMCAIVDPENLIAETSENDNIVSGFQSLQCDDRSSRLERSSLSLNLRVRS